MKKHRGRPPSDITGQTFGKLTAVERADRPDHIKSGSYWLCHCSCGSSRTVRLDNLKQGQVKSCGCDKKFLKSNGSKAIDLSGAVFGKLTVVERVCHKKISKAGTYWVCKCSCGYANVVSSNNLRRGLVRSCGCLKRAPKKREYKIIDLAGKTFGRLTVIGRTDRPKGNKYGTFWLCKCSCGSIRAVNSRSLVSCRSKSCGCLQRDIAKDELRRRNEKDN